MAHPKIKVSVDIGSTKTVVAVGRADKYGDVQILGLETAATVGVKGGQIENVDTLKTLLQSMIYAVERNLQINIQEIYLSISGEDTRSTNHSESIALTSKRAEITEEHTRLVAQKAYRRLQNNKLTFLHKTTKYFKLDGRKCMIAPIGKLGQHLEAHAHLIYTPKEKIETLRDLFLDIGIKVLDFVYTPIAESLLHLNDDHKIKGTLLINMGGHYTDFSLFCDGALEQTGTVNLGGEAITEDIHSVMNLPFKQAEALKLDHAAASLNHPLVDPNLTITFEDLYLQNKSIPVDHQMLNEVSYYRVFEIFELIKNQIPTALLDQITGGIILTGGASQMPEAGAVAAQIFDLEVYTTQAESNPNTSRFNQYTSMNYAYPENSTVIGLLHYAVYLDKLDHAKRGPSLVEWASSLFKFN